MPKSDYTFISWSKLVKLLSKHFSFFEVSQKWSHIKLKNKLGRVTIINQISPSACCGARSSYC